MATVGRRDTSDAQVTVSIWAELEPRRLAVEAALAEQLDRCGRGAPPVLLDAMRYSLLGGGKRLRPLLCLLACDAVGGRAADAMPAAVALEMVHTYSLVHDDLPAMDDDDLRRGRPTCHKVYGEALAILAGDALLTAAFLVAPHAAVTLAETAGASGMVGGQVLDLIADGRIAGPTPAAEADLAALHDRKTGALFRAALRLGVSHNPTADHAAYDGAGLAAEAYAAAFGLLFQVTDDLLDVESTEAATGKRVGKDAGRGKLTYPGLLGVEASRRKAAELCGEAVAAAETFGPAGRPLADLARWVATRDR